MTHALRQQPIETHRAAYGVLSLGVNEDIPKDSVVYLPGIVNGIYHPQVRETTFALASKFPGHEIHTIGNLGTYGTVSPGVLRNYSFSREAAERTEVMKQLGINRAIIVGLSLGGLIAAHIHNESTEDIELDFVQFQITPNVGGVSLAKGFIREQAAGYKRCELSHRTRLKETIASLGKFALREPQQLMTIGNQALHAIRNPLSRDYMQPLAGRVGFLVARDDHLTSSHQQEQLAQEVDGVFDELPGGHELYLNPHMVATYARRQYDESVANRTTTLLHAQTA